MFVRIGRQREPQASQQQIATLEGAVGAAQGRTHVVQRVHLDLGVADPGRERQSALPPGFRCLRVGGQHAQLRQIGVRHRQLVTVAQRLQRGDRP